MKLRKGRLAIVWILSTLAIYISMRIAGGNFDFLDWKGYVSFILMVIGMVGLVYFGSRDKEFEIKDKELDK